MEECQKKLEHKLGLDSYLLKPIQRLTKYQLLLKVRLRAVHTNMHTKSVPFLIHAKQVYVFDWIEMHTEMIQSSTMSAGHEEQQMDPRV